MAPLPGLLTLSENTFAGGGRGSGAGGVGWPKILEIGYDERELALRLHRQHLPGPDLHGK